MGIPWPIRILEVVGGGMNRGGTETWLLNVLRIIDRKKFALDFLVHTADQGAYDDEIMSLGSRILRCVHPSHAWNSRPWQYAKEFRRVVEANGPYDAIHSHVDLKGGYILRIASQCGIQSRISHCHTPLFMVSEHASPVIAVLEAGPMQWAYGKLMRRSIRRQATRGLACSGQAADAFYGPSWPRNPRRQVLYCGINLEPFQERYDRQRVREELGLPKNSLVMGHVGSFRSQQKNHAFLVRIAQEVAVREPDMRLLLVGDGALKSQTEQQVRDAGLDENVVFMGTRDDVSRLMMAAMDVFVFPSLFEGLGLVLIEAQAAGLPIFRSDVVPHEADVVKPLCHSLSLASPPAEWAEEIIRVHREGPQVTRQEALAAIEASDFNIVRSVDNLCRVYSECAAERTGGCSWESVEARR